MLQVLLAVTPVLVSALIGAFVAWHAAERGGLLANVTAERAAWRERIRCYGCELEQAVASDNVDTIRRLRMQFRLSLNPWDDRDREIVALLGVLIGQTSGRDETLERVAIRLELLLKHDWERAKAEASWIISRGRGRPAFRAALPRAGVDALSRLRRDRPIGVEFDERHVR